jgi:hypothetical protein
VGLEFELRAWWAHLSHTFSPFCSGSFWRHGLVNYLPRLAWITILLISASQVTRMTSVSHHHPEQQRISILKGLPIWISKWGKMMQQCQTGLWVE